MGWTEVCALAGQPLRVEIDAKELSAASQEPTGRVGRCTVEVTAALDPVDVETCAELTSN